MMTSGSQLGAGTTSASNTSNILNLALVAKQRVVERKLAQDRLQLTLRDEKERVNRHQNEVDVLGKDMMKTREEIAKYERDNYLLEGETIRAEATLKGLRLAEEKRKIGIARIKEEEGIKNHNYRAIEENSVKTCTRVLSDALGQDEITFIYDSIKNYIPEIKQQLHVNDQNLQRSLKLSDHVMCHYWKKRDADTAAFVSELSGIIQQADPPLIVNARVHSPLHNEAPIMTSTPRQASMNQALLRTTPVVMKEIHSKRIVGQPFHTRVPLPSSVAAPPSSEAVSIDKTPSPVDKRAPTPPAGNQVPKSAEKQSPVLTTKQAANISLQDRPVLSLTASPSVGLVSPKESSALDTTVIATPSHAISHGDNGASLSGAHTIVTGIMVETSAVGANVIATAEKAPPSKAKTTNESEFSHFEHLFNSDEQSDAEDDMFA